MNLKQDKQILLDDGLDDSYSLLGREPGTYWLSLKGNETLTQLKKIIEKIPKNKVKLNLLPCILQVRDLNIVFAELFQMLSCQITTIDLYGVFVHAKGEELPAFLATFPKTVTRVNLGGHLLGLRESNYMAKVLSSLRYATTVDLCNNCLDEKSTQELVEIFKTLSRHVENIIINEEDILSRSEKEIKDLAKSLPYVLQVDFLGYEDIEWPLRKTKLYTLNEHVGRPIKNLISEECTFPPKLSQMIFSYCVSQDSFFKKNQEKPLDQPTILTNNSDESSCSCCRFPKPN